MILRLMTMTKTTTTKTMKITKDYMDGYTKALLDVHKTIEMYQMDFFYKHKVNRKSSRFILKLIDAYIDNRFVLMKYGVGHFDLALMKNGKIKLKRKES